MRLLINIIVVYLFIVSCSSDFNHENSFIIQKNINSNSNIINNKKHLFKELDSSYTTNKILIPEGFSLQVLFSELDSKILRKDGKKFPSKGLHDMISYIPKDGSSNNGWLYVGHETMGANNNLGDGGGGTIFEIKKNNTWWDVISDYHHIDFSKVGNTERNCGGILAPNGMIYSCEEAQPKSNIEIYRSGMGHRDTSDINNLKYYENIGYVVEIDPEKREATRKMYQWGRFYHEDLEFLDDGKTIFLSDDYSPSVFFKFVADKKNDYSKGQLYAFSENIQDKWISLPMDTASLVDIRNIAISLGATMFVRHEWYARDGDYLYIAETGGNIMQWGTYINEGGVPAKHLEKFKNSDTSYIDYYGRILKFNIKTSTMTTWFEGGVSMDGTKSVTNPDCIQIAKLKGKKYLIFHEDILGVSEGRVSAKAAAVNKYYNEIFFIDLSLENPNINDAKRFLIAPLGGEMTGGIFSDDGSTFFVNLQHPSTINEYPYNNSSTFAITGF